jgi:hypothetical protein
VPIGASSCGDERYARRESNNPARILEKRKSGNSAAHRAAHGADLARIVAAWDKLPADVRAAILDLVDKAQGE